MTRIQPSPVLRAAEARTALRRPSGTAVFVLTRQARSALCERFGLEDVPCPMDLPHFEPERPHRMREATFFRLKCRLWRLTDQYRHRFITRAKAFLRLK